MDPDKIRRAVVQNPLNIQAMFNAIAPRYDALNHLLSFGLDFRWRRKALALVREKRGGTFLDVAAGSGDLTIESLRLEPREVVAADFATNMLEVFRRKVAGRSIHVPVRVVACDALALPFGDSSFDVTMVAFGIRNFRDRLAGLSEMLRVLKPGGLCLILELTTPTSPFVLWAYSLYARMLLPLVGTLISRHNLAYSYLPTSIAEFPDNEQFLSLMREAGYIEISARRLTFGVVTVYRGRKR